MPFLLDNFSVKALNTFGIEAKCKYYYKFNHVYQLNKIFKQTEFIDNFMVVGKGSNLLFTNDYNGLILQCGIEDIIITSKNSTEVIITASAGLDWDYFVSWCVKREFWGLENLSYIPGTVGAAPVQNIGAYGVEVAEFIERVTFYDPRTSTIGSLSHDECNFGYRQSIFKTDLKNVIVLSVDFKLSRVANRRIDYKDITNYISNNQIKLPLSLHDIRESIIAIRQTKLPDPIKIGNGGSFFKNPVLTVDKFINLQSHWSDIPSYKISDSEVKVPAAWLIDKCGWKGFRRDDAGVHTTQPLVLVNYGNASGKEILALAIEISDSVKNQFDIMLEREVIVI